MKFTTSCLVRVEDAKKREELMRWCCEIGYVQKYDNIDDALLVIAGFEDGQVDSALLVDDVVDALLGFIDVDCGTDVELFKALAAMNDENNLWQYHVCTNGQYFNDVSTGDLVLKRGDDDTRLFFEPFFRKATAEEIVEHFKNR